jgi:hypothetical protein
MSSVPRGLALPLSPFEWAMKIDPALVHYFFDEGEFVFQSGVLTNHPHPYAALFLMRALGSSIAERLLIEEVCSDFDRMGKLDMGDRLKSAKFKLKEVEAFEHRHGIGQSVEGLKKEAKPGPARKTKRTHDDLLEKALAHVDGYIADGQRITHDELYPFLNSISDEPISERVERAIWDQLPKKGKKGAGRPRKRE